ncbi:hypothetical protein DFP72DRAFT_256956 [Ephemerocybe angulata]|uniref:Uncharacterized protein n=1 Tax=Ephemerocybe angulata TaxID=980116 RepID=A0A8H6LTE1_9AGAR|nr:hypothetical protein DFP72DRAFT_256956 [Tulosesus angulatus]
MSNDDVPEEARPMFSDLVDTEQDAVSVGESAVQDQDDLDGEGAEDRDELGDFSEVGGMDDMEDMYQDEEEATQPIDEEESGHGQDRTPSELFDTENGRALRNRTVSKALPLRKSRSKPSLPAPSTRALENEVARMSETVATLQATVKDLGESVRALQLGGTVRPADVPPQVFDELQSTVAGLSKTSNTVVVTLEKQIHPLLKSHIAFRKEARAAIVELQGNVGSLLPLRDTTSAYGERLLKLELASRGPPGPVVPSKRAFEPDVPLFSFTGLDGAPSRPPAFTPPRGPTRPLPSRVGPPVPPPFRPGPPPPVTPPNSHPSHRRSGVKVVLVRIGPVDTKSVGEKAALSGWIRAARWTSGSVATKKLIVESIEDVWFSPELTHLMIKTKTLASAYDLAQVWNEHIRTSVPVCAAAFAETSEQENWVE